MITLLICLLLSGSPPELSYLDSLFIRATVGRIDYLELNEPARESLANFPEDSIGQYLINKFSGCSAREFHSLVDIFKKMDIRGRSSLLQGINTEDLDIKLASIYTAGEIKDTFLISQCIPLVNDSNYQVRANIARILYILNDSLALNNLIELVNDSVFTVKLYALISLGKIDIPLDYELPRLIHCVEDSNVAVRSAMAEIISKLNQEGLNQIIQHYPNLDSISKLSVIYGLASNPLQSAQNFIKDNLESFEPHQRAAVYRSWFNLTPGSIDSSRALAPSWSAIVQQEPYPPLKNYLQYIIDQESP